MTQLQVAYRVAKTQLGQKEIIGPKANEQILHYHAATSLHANSDEVPWCSAFVNWCYIIAGLILNPAGMTKLLQKHKFSEVDIMKFQMSAIAANNILFLQDPQIMKAIGTSSPTLETGALVKIGTRNPAARSWLGWGAKVKTPKEGDLVCFTRGKDGWSGHIAFVSKVGMTYIDCLGGNQSDKVSIAPYARARVLGYMVEA